MCRCNSNLKQPWCDNCKETPALSDSAPAAGSVSLMWTKSTGFVFGTTAVSSEKAFDLYMTGEAEPTEDAFRAFARVEQH